MFYLHYDDVIMTMLASQITSLTVVYSIVYSGVNQRKHQSSASLAFVREIHRGPVNFPHKWPVTRKMFPFDDVIMCNYISMQIWFWSQSMDEYILTTGNYVVFPNVSWTQPVTGVCVFKIYYLRIYYVNLDLLIWIYPHWLGHYEDVLCS